MRLNNNELFKAVRYALYAGASAVVGLTAAPVFAQDQGEKLETIVVTGSRIRRVDLETSNPVLVVDKAAIEKSGKLTLGDLVQELPAISGNASNPSVNNGGGDGGSYVSLRGLGVQRSLILINGRRFIANPFFGGSDVNMIPASLVERIEILKSGAAAIYGSDAIGGVVNFILRSNYQGAEFITDYGISDRDDGARQGYKFTFGQTSDKGSIMAGVDYNKQDLVSSADRDYAKDATYLYSGSITKLGSSRNPYGRIDVTGDLQAQFGCATVTRIAGTSGATMDDYRCYNGATDSYNYQAVGNVVLTPQERTNAFVVGNYKLSDSVETYLEIFHSKTTSAYQIAPLPFDARADQVVISKDSYYNPFGTDFGAIIADDGSATLFPQMRTRFVNIGNRRSGYTTTTDQVNAGFKGSVGDTSWTWDAGVGFGHYSQLVERYGYVYQPALAQQVGPSYMDPTTGQILCGTPGNPINGCTPLNIFNLDDPTAKAVLEGDAATIKNSLLSTRKQAEINATGNLFELPAGTVSLAVGAAYRKDYQKYTPDYLTLTDPNTLSCLISTEACTGPTRGGFDLKEFYAEALVPILKDMPFANSLNLIIGDRYSDYSNVGNSNNLKLALEWRPIDDLLLRATVSDVFRAPTTSEIYSGIYVSNPVFADPCIGLVGTNAACQYVPSDGSYGGGGALGTGQITTKVSGADAAGITLSPEQGKSFDFGAVYDPQWIEGLSLNVDVWRVYLNNMIVTLNANTVASLCYNSGTVYCDYIHRYTDGQVNYIDTPTVNLGRLDTRGVDFGFKYRLPETFIGNFRVGLDTTYTAQYNNDQAPGIAGGGLVTVAGHYDQQYGNFARWRALGTVDWNMGPWSAAWKLRYIGPVSVGYQNPSIPQSADAGFPNVQVPYGSYTYHNASMGYNIEPLNARVDLGMDNVFDKQPPLFFQNNVLNANTDVNTYETVGRYYWARLSVKF